MTNAIKMNRSTSVERKKVSISSKRQITIPQKFFALLGFDNEAECTVRGNELVIRPVSKNSGGEFSSQILEELISEGLSGEELLKAFNERQAKIRPAVEAMIDEAEKAARGEAKYYTYNDIFESED